MTIAHQEAWLQRGVLYVAVGRRTYLEEGVESARALIAQEPGTRVAVLSDLEGSRELCLSHGLMHGMMRGLGRSGRPSRAVKTALARLTPFRETLFLDTDIVPLAPWGSIWTHLRDGVIGVVPDPETLGTARQSHGSVEHIEMLARFGASQRMFNAGVLLWRQGPETAAAFDRWHAEWRKHRDVDQFALVRSEPPIVAIPAIYNDQLQDGAEAARARGTLLWHHWYSKHDRGDYAPAGKWVAVSRELRRRALAIADRMLPPGVPSVRWTLPPGIPSP